MRAIVLINAAAGSAQTDGPHQPHRIRRALSGQGVQADIWPVHAGRLPATARRALAARPDALVAAGGDGTISAVAGVLAGSDVPLGILPLGTLNHFAKDLGIPADLDAAAQVIGSGRARLVDTAQVNHRIFVNNSSVGLYPHVVAQRDQQRQHLGWGKWWAMLNAAVDVLRWHPTVRARVAVNGQTVPCDTPFLFVGNNAYELDLFTLGARNTLESGELCIYFTTRAGRLATLRLAVRAILGLIKQARDFTMLRAQELWVDSPRRRLRVAVDGEVVEMAPPLHYRIRPRSLRVLAP